MNTFDPTKLVQTRDGRKARIICTDAVLNCGAPIVALVTTFSATCIREQDTIRHYHLDGTYTSKDHSWDLVNIPERILREKWVNLYPDPANDSAYVGRSKADYCAVGGRIACVRVVIDCNEGEGLDGCF